MEFLVGYIDFAQYVQLRNEQRNVNNIFTKMLRGPLTNAQIRHPEAVCRF